MVSVVSGVFFGIGFMITLSTSKLCCLKGSKLMPPPPRVYASAVAFITYGMETYLIYTGSFTGCNALARSFWALWVFSFYPTNRRRKSCD
jgi:hypothetical protein